MVGDFFTDVTLYSFFQVKFDKKLLDFDYDDDDDSPPSPQQVPPPQPQSAGLPSLDSLQQSVLILILHISVV